MFRKPRFKKVRPEGKGRLATILDKIGDRFQPKPKTSHSKLDYYTYRIKEWASKNSHILPGVAAIIIAIVGLIIIDMQFQPIQTPEMIFSKTQNLNHMNALFMAILLWVVNLKRAKVPIYR